MEREIKNEQEVLGQFVRALRHRKPSPRCARVLLAPSPAPSAARGVAHLQYLLTSVDLR